MCFRFCLALFQRNREFQITFAIKAFEVAGPVCKVYLAFWPQLERTVIPLLEDLIHAARATD